MGLKALMSTRVGTSMMWVLLCAVIVAGCGTPSRTTATPATPSNPGTAPTTNELGSSSTTNVAESRCHPDVSPTGWTVYRGDPAGCTAQLITGAVLVLDIPPVSLGRVGPATSSNLTVVSPITVPEGVCASDDTCSVFLATATGAAILSWTGASGCVPGGPCVAAARASMAVVVDIG